jgi:hypothetical protein
MVGITLIVTKSHEDKETGDEIALDDWLNLVKHDGALRLRTEPTVVVNPKTNEGISIEPLPGQTELRVGNEYVPFLGFRFGKLVMRFTAPLEDEQDPVRRKVAEVARLLGAIIIHDAGEEILRW